MIRKALAATAVAVMLGSVGAEDYCFPSPVNPGGKDVGSIDQFISIIWDDNAYSGLDGTTYEADSGKIEWKDGNCVGGEAGLSTHGFPSWVPHKNTLNIEEGDMGMAWAIQLGVDMTFNMISGLYIPTSNPSGTPGEGWMNRESELGHYVPRSEDGVDHKRIAVAWGREQAISDAGEEIQPNCAVIATNKALSEGHEIGNHTIDHMESNSPLPGSKGSNPYGSEVKGESNIEGFAAWGGEGFDDEKLDEMPWGEVIDEATEFGQEDGASAQYMGWKVYAGRYISTEAWQGAIELAEEYLISETDVTKSKLWGFRAPRLEVSSGLYHGLKNAGYEYDCGLEEGYEDHRNGENFLWPYTVDNGAQNTWTQYSVGERRTITDWPTGLWQIPVNVLIVPEGIRESVWANHAEVMKGEGEDADYIAEAKTHWMTSGKVTGFDFNTYILWGMTTDNWKKTMENTVDLRLSGNKAPLHYGAHTDYYTPIYDNQTLLTSFNIKAFGLCVVNDWNKWDTRITAMEEWISTAKGKGCKFVTGHQLIEEVKKIQGSDATPGTASTPGDTTTWAFNKNSKLNSKTTVSTFENSVEDVVVTVDAPQGDVAPYCSYYVGLTADELTHIGLDYKVEEGALAVRLHFSDTTIPSREVLLNNVNNSSYVNSGKIPLHAFDFNKYESADKVDYSKPIDASKIVSIEIQPLAPENKNDGTYETRDEPFDVKFSVKNVTAYGSGVKWFDSDMAVVNTAGNVTKTLGINALTSKALKLNIVDKGAYNVQILQANGRVVKSFSNEELTAGVNSLALNNIASGVYMINVENITASEVFSQKAVLK